MNRSVDFRVAQEFAATLSAIPWKIRSIAVRLAFGLIRPASSRRGPRPSEATQPAAPLAQDPFKSARDIIGDLFDPEFYRELNEDVRLANIDPLQHYLEYGWREGRNPSRGFDTRYYLAQNPDVVQAGENPLFHFARIGAGEGRRPMPVDFAREQIARARSPREQAADWLRPSRGQAAAREELRRCLAELGAADAIGLIVSLSHDDYATIAGGVQNCVGTEAAIFVQRGWIYLHASPAQPLPMLNDELDGDAFRLVLTANGGRLPGEFRFSDLAAELAALPRGGPALWLVIHHLLGHSPELVAELARIVGSGRTIVWIHDFFTLCPNWVLLRNDVEFCHAPSLSSTACAICCYGEERRTHADRMRAFFDLVAPIVLSPSQLALDFWLGYGRLRHTSGTVVPPCRVVLGNRLDAADVGGGDDQALRVAFVGSATYLKGWHMFEELARRHRGDSRYAFYELNARRRSKLAHVSHVMVDVSPQHRMRMVDALLENRIDVVVLWSLCNETFSFTMHEALAAGVAIISRTGAGNIAAAASAIAPRQICILENEAELLAGFASGRVRDLALAENRRRGTLVFGGHTADYLCSTDQVVAVSDV